MSGTCPLYMGHLPYPPCSMVCGFRTTRITTNGDRNHLDKPAHSTDNGVNTIFPIRSAWHMDHFIGMSDLDRACRPSQILDRHPPAPFSAWCSFHCCGHFNTACRSKERRRRRGPAELHRDVPPGNRHRRGRFGSVFNRFCAYYRPKAAKSGKVTRSVKVISS